MTVPPKGYWVIFWIVCNNSAFLYPDWTTYTLKYDLQLKLFGLHDQKRYLLACASRTECNQQAYTCINSVRIHSIVHGRKSFWWTLHWYTCWSVCQLFADAKRFLFLTMWSKCHVIWYLILKKCFRMSNMVYVYFVFKCHAWINLFISCLLHSILFY